MNYRTLLYLAVTATGLGLLLWLLDQRDIEDRAAQTIQTRLFTNLDASSIIRVGITRETQQIDLKRHDRTWRIVQPLSARADNDHVHRLLATLEHLPIREIITPEEWTARDLHPRDFGLAPPSATVTLTATDRDFVILIGRDSPLDDGIYIRTPDEPAILLIDRDLIAQLPRTASDIREQSLFDGVVEDVIQLDIKPYAGQYVQLMREPNDRWSIRQPVTARTEPGAIRQRLNRLLDNRIQTFLPTNGSELMAGYGLEDEEAILALTLWKNGADTGTELFFGRETEPDGDRVFARRSDSDGIFTISRDVRDAFLVNADDLREKLVFHIDPWTVETFTLRDADETIKLQLLDNGWHVMQPVQWRADDEHAMNMLIRIVELRAHNFVPPTEVDPAAMGLESPRYGLAVWTTRNGDTPPDHERRPAGRMMIGNRTADGNAYYARRDGDPTVFTLSAGDLEGRLISTNRAGMALTDPLVYRDRSVLSIAPESVWRIEFQRGERRQTIDRAGDTWTVVEPAGHRANLDQVRIVLDSVRDLRALRVEQRTISQPAAFGFDQPGMVLTFHLTGADGLARTLITGFRARSDGLFAMVQGRDLVFALSHDTLGLLGRDLTHAAPQN